MFVVTLDKIPADMRPVRCSRTHKLVRFGLLMSVLVAKMHHEPQNNKNVPLEQPKYDPGIISYAGKSSPKYGEVRLRMSE